MPGSYCEQTACGFTLRGWSVRTSIVRPSCRNISSNCRRLCVVSTNPDNISGFSSFSWCQIICIACRRPTTTAPRAIRILGSCHHVSGWQVPCARRLRVQVCPHALRCLHARSFSDVSLQARLLLFYLRSQVPGHQDPVTGHNVARAGAAPGGPVHHLEAYPRLTLYRCRLLGEIALAAARNDTAAI